MGKATTLCIPIHRERATTVYIGHDAKVVYNTASKVLDLEQYPALKGRVLLTAVPETQTGATDSIKVVRGQQELNLDLQVVDSSTSATRAIVLEYITEREAKALAQVEQLEHQLATLTSETEQTKQQSAALEQQKAELTEQLSSIRQTLTAARQDRHEAEKQRDEAESRIIAIRDEFERYKQAASREADERVARARETARDEQFVRDTRELASEDGTSTSAPDEKQRYFWADRLSLEMLRGIWRAGEFRLAAKLSGKPGQPVRLHRVKAQGPNGEHIEARLAVLEDGVIADGETERIGLGLVIPIPLANATITIELFEHGSAVSVLTASVFPPEWRDGRILVPMTAKEIAEKNRKEAAEKREQERQQRGKQVLIGVQGFYGAYFMRDGAGPGGDNIGGTEATTVSGLGVRVTKGFIPEFAFEAEFVGGTTGSAQWDDIVVDGEGAGVLTREAWFGRASGSAVGRMGDKINPYFRIGVGVQVAGNDARFSAGMAPDSTTEVTYFLGFGGGINLRLGEHLVLGAGVSFEPGLQESKLFDNSLRAGLQLAYGWNP
ncbi:MAG: hypothetical protein AAGC55_00765 [Myxococcota bacterium]